ncbi:MAG: anti-sigma factor [Eubacteriales bacterium]|jgi:predicted anti-sigma-YlaC factor YlaD
MEKQNYIDKSRTITCREACSMIPGYLDGKLSDRDEAAFLRHVNSCASCRNELETNFMVNETIRYLDNNELESLDLRYLFRKNLRDSQRNLLKRRKMRRLRSVITFLTIVLFSLTVLDLLDIFKVTVFFEALL